MLEAKYNQHYLQWILQKIHCRLKHKFNFRNSEMSKDSTSPLDDCKVSVSTVMTSDWIICKYNDEGELTNPEFVSAPDDSYWWVDSVNRCHCVLLKAAILGYPARVARVWHPDEVVK